MAEALTVLRQRGVDLDFVRADLVVRWSGGRAELVSLHDILRLAEIATEHPAAGDVVIESLWRSQAKAPYR
ncbi:MAG: hypothetical protein ACUVRF_10105 [Desulfotomaculales bacterium]